MKDLNIVCATTAQNMLKSEIQINGENTEYLEGTGKVLKCEIQENDHNNVYLEETENNIWKDENESQENSINENDVYYEFKTENMQNECENHLIDITSDKIETVSISSDNLQSQTSNADKPYECHICGKFFSRNSSLKCHIRLHIEGPENMLKNSFNSDITNDTNTTSLNVDSNTELNKTISNSDIINDNLALVNNTDRTSNSSQEDNFVNINFENQNDHLVDEPYISNFIDEDCSVENGKEYKCVMCDKYFSRKSSLIFHYKFHPDQKLSKTEPNSDFTLENELNRENNKLVMEEHNDIHFVETENNSFLNNCNEYENENIINDYKCDVCDKSFSNIKSLKIHCSRHPIALNKYHRSNQINQSDKLITASNKCDICNKSFLTSKALKIHYSYHNVSKGNVNNVETEQEDENTNESHECDLCKKSFASSRALKIHFARHITLTSQNKNETESQNKNIDENDDTKQYKCYICDKYFARKSSLNWHLRSHENYISSKFRNQNNLIDENDQLNLKNININENLPNNLFTTEKNLSFDDYSAINSSNSLISSTTRNEELFSNKNMTNYNLYNDNEIEQQTESTSEFYKCDVCDKLFNSLRGMKIHSSHHKSLMLENDKEIDINKLSNENINGLYTCNICNKSFDSDKGLKIHFSRYCAFVSTDENDSNTNETNLQYNVTEFHKCSVCDKSFYSFRGLKIHSARHNSLSPENEKYISETGNNTDEYHKCELCEKYFESERGLKIHLARHTSLTDINKTLDKNEDQSLTGLHSCNTCKKSFDTFRGMKIHAARHNLNGLMDEMDQNEEDEVPNSIKNFSCEVCPKSFDTFRGMKIHLASHNLNNLPNKHEEDINKTVENENNDMKSYICEICNRSFSNFRGFKIHQSYHNISTTENEVDSNSEKSELLNHSDNIANNKTESELLQCNFCPKTFETRKGLIRHVAYHNGGYLPILNSNSLSKSSDAAINSNKNSGFLKEISSVNRVITESLTCDICQESFLNLRDLKLHIYNHTSNESFINNSIDKELKTNLNILKCNTCFKSFNTTRGLHIHEFSHKLSSKNTQATENDQEEAQAQHNSYHHSSNEINNLQICNSSKQSANNSSANESLESDINEKNNLSSTSIYQCTICKRIFNNERGLRRHIPYHNIDSSSIEQISIKNQNTNSNISKEHEDDNLTCKFCGRTFLNLKGLCRHVAYHKISINFSKKSKITSETLSEIEDIDTLKCKACNRSFDHLRSLRIHISYHRHSLNLQNQNNLTNLGKKVSLSSNKYINNTSNDVKTIADSDNSMEVEETDNKNFNCQYCSRSFHNNRALRAHVSYHKIGKYGPFEENLTKEINQTSNDELNAQKPFTCQLCSKSFENLKGLSRHKAYHNNYNNFSFDVDKSNVSVTYDCGICDNSFTDSISLKQHIASHSESSEANKDSLNNQHNLKRPSSSELSIENNEIPISSSENGVKYLCHECGKCFPNSVDLKTHAVFHEKLKKSVKFKDDDKTNNPFECVYCEKSFNAKDLLLEHVKSHTDTIENLSENEINDTSKFQKLINISHDEPLYTVDHITDEKHNEKELYRCLKCELTSLNKYQMILHSQSHVEEKFNDPKKFIHSGTYTMEHLYKDLAQKKNISHEMEQQKKNESLKCEFCDETFRWKSNLAVHVQRHITESRYRCGNCDKSFKSKLLLTKHVKKHIDENNVI